MTNRLSTKDAFASACEMLTALRDGQISATALVEFHLARIARYNQELNAIVIPNYKQARRLCWLHGTSVQKARAIEID